MSVKADGQYINNIYFDNSTDAWVSFKGSY